MTDGSQRVRDYMTTELLTVPPDMEIMRVVRMFVDNDVSGVAVVDSDGRPVGFLTERDCIEIALQAGYFDAIGGSVSDYMSTDVHSVSPDDSMMDLGQLFAQSPFRRCPVIENGRLVGLIARRDVLRALTSGAWFAAPDS